MDVSSRSGSLSTSVIADADSLLVGVSDDAVTQLLGAAFARRPLGQDGLRDARLVAFLLDVDWGRYSSNRVGGASNIAGPAVTNDRLGVMSGLPVGRIERALSRLLEAGVLERPLGGESGWLGFSGSAVRPVGANQYVDWPAVLGVLTGRAPAISVLRATLDLVGSPWEWSRLTYERLAARACYSVGMAQRGVAQLIEFGVLERFAHTGRGHDYRLSAWALGRAPARPASQLDSHTPPLEAQSLAADSRAVTPTMPAPVQPEHQLTSTMAVEIGGLVVRVPVGTEIHMIIGPNGEPSYLVGSDLKITRRG